MITMYVYTVSTSQDGPAVLRGQSQISGLRKLFFSLAATNTMSPSLDKYGYVRVG